MPHLISLLALDGCFASNVVGTVDLLHSANLIGANRDPPLGPVFEWQVLSLDGRPVRASNGYFLPVDAALKNAPSAKVVVIPALSIAEPGRLGERLDRHRPLLPWLRAQHRTGVTIAAVCSGSFLLAESGLLDRKPATTTWWLAPQFEKRYPKVALDCASMLTNGGRVICAGTGMSHLDLALHLIEKYGSRALAKLCAKYVVLDSGRRSQAPYTVLNHLRSDDPLIVKAEKWVRANLQRNISIEDIAAHVAVSPRTLARRFKARTGDSPQAFLQKMRLETSKALLENTALRTDQILDRIGYGDDSAFRRLFKRHTSLSPRDYRKRFGIRK
ncbi:MAG TPA: helix-turn-helix domain-containing protein [Burkholderiales bacterium]|nr:helix-turn-helix domain-containing protein [Burkholderiales bacterium]